MLVAVIAASSAVASNLNAQGNKLQSPKAQGMEPRIPAGSSANDFDLVRETLHKSGSPHSKGEWSRLNSYVILNRTENNRDLVREMRDMNGSPKAIAQQLEQGREFEVAPVK